MPAEIIKTIRDDKICKIEYIKSNGQRLYNLSSPYTEVAILLSGKAQIIMDNKKINLTSPSQIIIPKNKIHGCYNLSSSGLWLTIYYK